jgi:lyso-ornithine lipid O-acyltransferase
MLSIIKFFFVCFTIFLYFLFTAPLYPLLNWFPHFTKKILNRLIRVCSKILLTILDIQIEHNVKGISVRKGNFIVSNHLSYLDILVISSLVPTCFVTSIEMKKTPFLGQIIQLAGCLFVERRNRNNIHYEIKEIERALKAGLNVTVFPEATSTNGEQVLQFKRSLFQAAISGNANLLPLTLNYTHLNGNKVTLVNRDYLCWYGEMSFLPHLWKLCQQNDIVVQVVTTGYVEVNECEHCPSTLRDIAFNQVHSAFIPIASY